LLAISFYGVDTLLSHSGSLDKN